MERNTKLEASKNMMHLAYFLLDNYDFDGYKINKLKDFVIVSPDEAISNIELRKDKTIYDAMISVKFHPVKRCPQEFYIYVNGKNIGSTGEFMNLIHKEHDLALETYQILEDFKVSALKNLDLMDLYIAADKFLSKTDSIFLDRIDNFGSTVADSLAVFGTQKLKDLGFQALLDDAYEVMNMYENLVYSPNHMKP